jgi:membrane-associated protease RseP (regulator of RpoE activity)
VSETQDLSPFFAPPAVPLFIPPAHSRWREYGRPALLFVVTAAGIYAQGLLVFEQRGAAMELVLSVMAIMLAHEMGHYLACRYYGVDATLPHFLPAPLIFTGFASPPMPLSLTGTFGAFIRIRGPIPNRKALFDIGVAGPLAGFAVCILVLGLAVREVMFAPLSDAGGISLNLPTAFSWALRYAPAVAVPPGMTPTLGPFGLAAWFGLFLTALNLMPVGQLDGGHATYALLTRYAHRISRVGMWISLVLVYFSPSWLLWAILLRVVGRPHPPTLDDDAPVGGARAVVGAVTLAVFVVCFMPRPIEMDWPEFLAGLRGLFAEILSVLRLT